MRKTKYLAIFVITLLLGIMFGHGYLTSPRSPRPIALNPVPLEIVDGNPIARCRLGVPLDSPADDPRCYQLQESLNTAVLNNDLNGIKNALQSGANVNGRYYHSFAPLTEAAMSGNKEAALLLIENGADVNKSGDFWKTSPLQQAVNYGHIGVAEILLENGADICHKANWDVSGIWDNPNPTALDIARKNGNESAVDLLISFGARRCFW